MPPKPKYIPYSQLDEESKKEVDRRMVELKTADPPHSLKEIISMIRNETKVVIKQHHIYQALKKSPELVIKPIHKKEEIQSLEEEPKPFSIEELRETISYYPRKIRFHFNEQFKSFYVVRLSESKKYGIKTSEKITETMEQCVIGTYSLMDNLIFPPSRSFEGKGRLTKKEKEQGLKEKIIEKKVPAGLKRGVIRVDTDENYVPRTEVIEIDIEGNPLQIIPSSLDLKEAPRFIELKEVITIDEVLDHDISMHYALFPIEDGDDSELKEIMYTLEESDPPKFLAFPFTYYASTTPYDAFLQLIEEKGKKYVLLSVGTRNTTEFIGLEDFPEEVLDIDENIELDFTL